MKLLVSPVNLEEAKAAIAGGADIIDVKNPNEGSLGANFPWVIKEIKSIVPCGVELSATIGDFPHLPGTASLAARGAASCGVDYVKVGLLGPRDKAEGVELMKAVVRAVKESNPKINVVACGYADHWTTNSVSYTDVPEIAESSGAGLAMIDTLGKKGGSLFEFMSKSDLAAFVENAQNRSLLTAVGGSIAVKQLKDVYDADVDIIGVRGAVCSNGRDSAIVEEKVRKFKDAVSRLE
ncbi:MAG: hypothetical protein MSIBF_02255 [Candidatus Altiarchaeales archaeon IMC4]|nr:MAG: hypothetical protein MSIBF_02255 [Candidatus Altiarchaeales archaeon IMC4]